MGILFVTDTYNFTHSRGTEYFEHLYNAGDQLKEYLECPSLQVCEAKFVELFLLRLFVLFMFDTEEAHDAAYTGLKLTAGNPILGPSATFIGIYHRACLRFSTR